MFFIRFFSLICFFSVCCGFSAFADSLWGNPDSERPRAVLKGSWGENPELLREKRENTFDLAGLFFKEESEGENIPLPPWLENAVAIPDVAEESPMIAIVIDDLGINRKMTQEVLELPGPLTASFLYYADDLPDQTRQAEAAGHELLVHTPMEPINAGFDPGPGALKTQMSAQEITDRLDLMLEAFSGYVGINNHMGSRFTANEQVMRPVMEEVKKRGLLFLDSLTSSRSVAGRIADEQNIPYAVRNVFLDNAQDEREIMKQLALLERHARKHRFAVGIGHPHKETVQALKRWIPQAKQKGFVFVPISMIAVYLQDEKNAENIRALNQHDEGE